MYIQQNTFNSLIYLTNQQPYPIIIYDYCKTIAILFFFIFVVEFSIQIFINMLGYRGL